MRTLVICALLSVVHGNTQMDTEQTSLLQNKVASKADMSAEPLLQTKKEGADRSAGCAEGSSGCHPEATTTTTTTTTSTTTSTTTTTSTSTTTTDAVPAPCNAEMHEPAEYQQCISGVFDTTVDFTKSHAVHFRLRMPDADTVDDEHQRQWLFSAAKAKGTEHWLWSPTGQFGEHQHGHIQFGVWSGPQIKDFEGSDDTKSDILEATSLTAVYDADTRNYILYMNGKDVQSIDGVDFIMPEKKLYLGVYPHAPTADTHGTQSKFTGCIEKVQIFDRDLLAGEVNALDTSPPAQCMDVPPSNCPTPDDAYTCHFWGDPHFTHLFFMEKLEGHLEAQKGGRMNKQDKMFDFNLAGVFDLAESSDGSFESQAFFCPAYHGTTVGVGLAMRFGDDLIQVVRGAVTAPKSEDPKHQHYWADLEVGSEEDVTEFFVNGEKISWHELGDAAGTRGKDVNGNGGISFRSAYLQQMKTDHESERIMLPVCAGDGAHNLVEVGTPYFPPPKEGKRGRLYEPAVTIRSNNPGDAGLCSSDVASVKANGEQFRVDAKKNLFSAKQMKSLCGMCRLDMNGGACGAPGHTASAEDVCNDAGGDYSAAKAACGQEFEEGSNWFFTCVMETCVSGEGAVSIAKIEQQLQNELISQAEQLSEAPKGGLWSKVKSFFR